MSVLHITNGDSAGGTMRESGIGGDVLPWRDVLHEGPVPARLPLEELSEVRANFLADAGAGQRDALLRDFRERDARLQSFTDYDEVVLWFEWDLYDQLQLIQILEFFAGRAANHPEESGTRLSIVSHAGYLGNLEADAFPPLFSAREAVSAEMLSLGQRAWNAFRSDDPRSVERITTGDTSALPFLGSAFRRELEEFPSVANGLSRSESQILETIAHGPRNFTEIFRSVSNREERIFCGDFTFAGYIERMSNCDSSLITYQSGEKIDVPRQSDDWRAFRNAEMALTEAGRAVLSCEQDWIALGGSDRWLGGVHLDRGSAEWRWDQERSMLREIRMDTL